MGRKLDRWMRYVEKEDQGQRFSRIKVKITWGQNVVENMSLAKAFSPWAGTVHQNPGGREGMN